MKKIGKIIIVIAIVAIAVVAVKIGPSVMDYFLNSSKTTKIGFEDIAELDTQVAYCNVIGVVNDSKKVFGKELPFTRSKYIYSYNVVVKAGLNFKEISWEKSGEKIKVQMPKMHVTDSYIDEKSGKVYQTPSTTHCSMFRLVAVIMRTSERISSVPPSGMKRCSCM